MLPETLGWHHWQDHLCVALLNFGKKLNLSVRGGRNLCLFGLTFALLLSFFDGFVIDRIEHLVSNSHGGTNWLASGVLLPVSQLRSLLWIEDWVLEDVSFVDRLDLIKGVLQRACGKFSLFMRDCFLEMLFICKFNQALVDTQLDRSGVVGLSDGSFWFRLRQSIQWFL
jgi:hypothetical protein